MPRTVKARLQDMADAIAGIEETLAGKGYEEFARVWHLQKATERGLEIISEASRSLSAEMKALTPEVPWPEIAGIGNVLRHDYQRIEALIIWNIVGKHLPGLKAALTTMQAQARD